MEEVKRSLSELQSSLEGVSEERIRREKDIEDNRRKLRAVEGEIKAKPQRNESLHQIERVLAILNLELPEVGVENEASNTFVNPIAVL